METCRYICLKHLVNSFSDFDCYFSKYGHKAGTRTKTTCLKVVQSLNDNDLVIDHIWVKSQTLVNAKLRTGQKISITAKVKKRKRPGLHIFDDVIMDITLTKVTLRS